MTPLSPILWHPTPVGRPRAAVSLELGGFPSVPLPPAMLGVGQGHECPLLPTQDSAWGLEAPEVSHTPCQDPPWASPSSHETPEGKGPGAKAGGHGSGQRAWMEESVACPPRWPPLAEGQAGMGWQPRLLGALRDPPWCRVPGPGRRPQAHGLRPCPPTLQGEPELPGHVYFIKHKLRSR